jgi:chemotaxis protein CheX
MFQVEEKDKSVVIKLPATFDMNAGAQFETQSAQWLIKAHPMFVLDFAGVLSVDSKGASALVKFSHTLKKNDKRLFSVNVPQKIQRELSSTGMMSALHPVDTLDKAYEEAGFKKKGPARLDAQFLNPFVAAVIHLFKSQFQMDIINKKTSLKKDAEPINLGIAGVISLACSHFAGTISLGFPTPVFLKLYETWLGEKHAEITSECEDGAAELLNIVYATAKTELNRKGYEFEKALPTVMVGEKLRISQSQSSQTLVLHFGSGFGDFVIEISTN